MNQVVMQSYGQLINRVELGIYSDLRLSTSDYYVEDCKPFYERFENILIATGNKTRCYPDITIKYGVGGAAFKHEFPDASLRVYLVEGWNAYPNPSEGELFELLKSEQDEPYEITIFDITGKLVSRISRQTSNRKYWISTEELPKGIYFAQVNTNSGKAYTHKLILK
jgi:hypothetical protein